MERRAVTVRGIVQGVGFRPYVYRLATGCQLSGSVRNVAGDVCIEIEGRRQDLDRFCQQLPTAAPPLAAITEICSVSLTCRGDREFEIAISANSTARTVFVAPDVATCVDCLRELFNPADRRYRYPFLNCTNCGPRLTIVRAAPYDRQRTTMAPFPMCDECQREYEDPQDRRYHAQPTCCRRCGPTLRLLTRRGEEIVCEDPVAELAKRLQAGQIGALKGLGGYHLACDATNSAAVERLRSRKGRDDKPFALMVANADAARRLCHVNAAECELLESRARPIVLLQRRPGGDREVAPGVAPGNPYLGLMLPYTPLHHLLMDEMLGRPLVMTSGNRADEPIAYEDEAALEQLGEIADVLLTHNRPIQVRCDDSVTRIVAGRETPIRRSRGYAPRPIALPVACAQPVLAVGGQLKSTFAVGRERAAVVSHHLGDLDDYRAYRAFECDIALYEQLLDVQPRILAHDLHPDYASTDYAIRRAADQNLACVAVQHHHAHVAACMAEHRFVGPVIGVAFDGSGLGTDGAIWGGEILVADYLRFHRAAHLRYVPLPGGDRAVRQPWRSALAHLVDAGCDVGRLNAWTEKAELQTVRRMIERGVNCPWTSSAGRLFDAVAAISGLRGCATFEGQAAMELEWLATGTQGDGAYPFELVGDECGEAALTWDTRPLVRSVVDDLGRGVDRARIARRFHTTLVEMIAEACGRIRRRAGLQRVVLSGGVFANALLTREAQSRLLADGFDVYRHEEVPPGDGGLSLGQLAVAAAKTSLLGLNETPPSNEKIDRVNHGNKRQR